MAGPVGGVRVPAEVSGAGVFDAAGAAAAAFFALDFPTKVGRCRFRD